MIRPAAALVVLACTAGATAHERWLDGKMIDPLTKMRCCGENDCHIIPERQAHATKDGYRLDDTGELIEWPRVQPSPDGGIWACRWGGETKCFFAPYGNT
jgi:hypothetical protein